MNQRIADEPIPAAKVRLEKLAKETVLALPKAYIDVRKN